MRLKMSLSHTVTCPNRSPHHLRVTSGVGETKTDNLLFENALMKQ
mgnify:CR=1 FL=1